MERLKWILVGFFLAVFFAVMIMMIFHPPLDGTWDGENQVKLVQVEEERWTGGEMIACSELLEPV